MTCGGDFATPVPISIITDQGLYPPNHFGRNDGLRLRIIAQTAYHIKTLI